MTNSRLASPWLLGATMFVTLTLLRAPDETGAPGSDGQSLVTEIMSAEHTAGFRRVTAPRPFEFPKDHYDHPGYRSEWWYFTGQLGSAKRPPAFGFQLTFFRYETAPKLDHSVSAWRTPAIIMAHFALADFNNGQFHSEQRLFRALPSVAGISNQPFRIWLDDWNIEHHIADQQQAWHLSASQNAVALDLILTPQTQEVLQGKAGMAIKGAGAGNASYYYSVPRLSAQGTVRLGQHRQRVEGLAWLDREWSTSALDRTQQGWDWFALHLADGRSLMFYQLRRRDGSKDRFSSGSLTGTVGDTEILSANDVVIEVIGYWTSPKTGIRYPSGWLLHLPRHDLSIALKPQLKDQEWTGRFNYWEGAVSVTEANDPGGAPFGEGYVELTGYDRLTNASARLGAKPK